MDSFQGTSALITGGASGIGLGLATALLEEGAAHVVLADIEPGAIDASVAALGAKGLGEVSGVVCDVSDPTSVDAAAEEAWDRTGGLQVVGLNAGVFAGGWSWEATLDDWDWVLGVNLRGIIHGIRSFVPRLIDAGRPAHVLGTASIAGIVSAPASTVYCTSKFAAVGLMECLSHDLRTAGHTHVAASVICPGMVHTNIDQGERNRPADLAEATVTDASGLAQQAMAEALAIGMDPVEGARHALAQAKAGRFYVTTHSDEFWSRMVGNQNEDRLAGVPPRFQMFD